ncbi:UDP-N-acetylmuramoyl-L-alanine--D-glutamate ligase [Corynebacterium yudongzhengii]|uniref:UDP-N-acetylmuramoylalanine--D-glutamate ligase n=1 Tax=Corynebacterium yudongzhengii TaxID=2080740 RepID=A0A2U1T781_9CORY|nr:UDP-N-acetylmuramoyl-L-alanine--D-glutamate ligase [Corynebacterium yudongzhengii]AWB81570.1 UDP-N-acetylmuramoyl-L-alanine--D-glutamate ligase [Corynebacterium yudongzhengii]PWC01860.1 UDP-N-acetylmuramoyl-L-alanine--D-glutamate ligase [Corynebacterium yudongzhengii]
MSAPVTDVVGTRPVVVAGAGVSGVGIARLLHGLGVKVVLVDDNLERARSIPGVEGVDTFTASRLIDDAAIGLVVTSPGWRPSTPLLRHAAEKGLEVIGDVELCYRLDRAGVFGAPRTWLVITGTNGKTTTTAMLAEIMAAHDAAVGTRSAAVGNIGVAVADALVDPRRVDILVAELSSFQLHWSSELTPDTGCLLNLAEDHIDWHGSMAAYARDKARVFSARHAVAGIDDPLVVEQLRELGREDYTGFTLHEPRDNEVGVIDGRITYRRNGELIDIAPTEGIEPPGPAGILDALAASAVALTQDVPAPTIARALLGFRVAGHRGAIVHRGKKVWIDNSKATNPHAADAALAGIDGAVTWIAGGQLKGADVDELVATHADRLTSVGLLGADAAEIARALGRHAPKSRVFITEHTDPAAAMDELVAFAAHEPATTVLLAPAAASLDMFTGMAQRGQMFADAARSLDHSSEEETR